MLLFAFDGTWKADDVDDDQDTNVCHFLATFPSSPKNKYTKGVGTKWGAIGKIFGGAFGVGGWARIIGAEKHLAANWNGTDELVVVGFSRGAALALDFADEVGKGVKVNGNKLIPTVRFLGLWDVVASFGVPGNKINLGYQLTVGPHVQHCFHAMALDERRYNFGLTRVKYAEDKKRPDGEKRAYEVWFRGGHSDIGGGNRNRRRSDISLRWMMQKAIAAGVPIDPARMPGPLSESDQEPDIRIKTSMLEKARKPAEHERVHATVLRTLDRGHVDPPAPWQEEPQ